MERTTVNVENICFRPHQDLTDSNLLGTPNGKTILKETRKFKLLFPGDLVG